MFPPYWKATKCRTSFSIYSKQTEAISFAQSKCASFQQIRKLVKAAAGTTSKISGLQRSRKTIRSSSFVFTQPSARLDTSHCSLLSGETAEFGTGRFTRLLVLSAGRPNRKRVLGISDLLQPFRAPLRAGVGTGDGKSPLECLERPKAVQANPEKGCEGGGRPTPPHTWRGGN